MELHVCTCRFLICCVAALTALTAFVASQQIDDAATTRRNLLSSATPAITDVELYEPEHYSPSTLSGGRGGGTRVRLLGNNLLNPDGSFDTSIIVTLGGQPAALVPFYSTSKQLVVDTPAKAPQAPDCCHSFQVWFRQPGASVNCVGACPLSEGQCDQQRSVCSAAIGCELSVNLQHANSSIGENQTMF